MRYIVYRFVHMGEGYFSSRVSAQDRLLLSLAKEPFITVGKWNLEPLQRIAPAYFQNEATTHDTALRSTHSSRTTTRSCERVRWAKKVFGLP